ncbi:VOC family protein [Cellulomonas marina]|uniref:VOC domain-containing protein n=1 Tax=Cellulomonas marina TaxID=988821 RepID=A0A1I0V2T1_9CELL|nr:VOC family protein [Cellulomonas marina]GIG28288.1 glyoxalase [Cellulomonas marina]SFA70552.1 hypothetical protein SAMN05421867_101115 [Cellulomonas marina]
MQLTGQTIVFDTADLASSSAFWADLLDGTVTRQDEDWHEVTVEGRTTLAFQLAPDHVPPQWPDGQPQQIHLDLYVQDITAAHAEALAKGARLLQDADLSAPEGFVVYADPAGHPFCLCWG